MLASLPLSPASPIGLRIVAGPRWARRPIRKHLVFWVMALACSHAGAASEGFSPGEIALMPEYCPDSQTFSPRYAEGAVAMRQRKWVGLMGESFWDIHHYCWAVAATNRSKLAGVDKQHREYLLKDAVNDISYVLRRARPDFILLPEIFTQLGDIQLQRERPADAWRAYEQAMEAKADYWPAYVRLADLQVSLGFVDKAMAILDQGLSRLPEQPQLLLAKARLSQQVGKKGSR